MKLTKEEIVTSQKTKDVTTTKKQVFEDDSKTPNSLGACLVALVVFVTFMLLGILL